MTSKLHVCVDRKLFASPDSAERMALVKGSLWRDVDVLHVSFMGGDKEVHERVERIAQEWCRHASLQLRFGDNPRAQLRIAFQPDDGSWSYIGTDCLKIAKTAPTMNLGWLTRATPESEARRVVLHEFGHALGCIHEHQNPAEGIQWNEKAVIEFYKGSPNYWDEATTRANVLNTYDKTLTVHSDFDKDSIMLYPVPKEFTRNGFSVGWNQELSAKDKEFIQKMYPQPV